jgi:hypothetical protein
MKASAKNLLEDFIVKRKEIILLVLCVVIGFALRVYKFDQKSLWVDEIHTFNDSRDGLRDQIEFYKKNPTYLHPPLFFALTHSFYPFPKPERDLRLLPLIFGTLSVPMIYFLARSFAPGIALACTLSLTFMAYHIYLSQDGRSYSMSMFLGMGALYFFLMHLKTSGKAYLFPAALLFSVLFQASYTSLLFIVFSQLFWLYSFHRDEPKAPLASFVSLNGLIFLFSLPWLLFIALNYKKQPIMDPQHLEDPGAIWSILHGIFNDWVSNTPLVIASLGLLLLSLLISKSKRNGIILLAVLLVPISGLYLFCRIFNITHFLTSRYFINFLPLFFISIYLSLERIEGRFENLKRIMQPKRFFVALLVASNVIILPLYYRSEKQDLRGLATYLKNQVQTGDAVFVAMRAYLPGILHYLGVYPQGRHQVLSFSKDLGKGIQCPIHLVEQNKRFTIYNSDTCCVQYLSHGNRVWIVVARSEAKKLKEGSPYVLKGYFDGSFANYRKFPTDASMYLFLWDPRSSNQGGLEMTFD